jgi:hypothetical protein
LFNSALNRSQDPSRLRPRPWTRGLGIHQQQPGSGRIIIHAFEESGDRALQPAATPGVVCSSAREIAQQPPSDKLVNAQEAVFLAGVALVEGSR